MICAFTPIRRQQSPLCPLSTAMLNTCHFSVPTAPTPFLRRNLVDPSSMNESREAIAAVGLWGQRVHQLWNLYAATNLSTKLALDNLSTLSLSFSVCEASWQISYHMQICGGKSRAAVPRILGPDHVVFRAPELRVISSKIGSAKLTALIYGLRFTLFCSLRRDLASLLWHWPCDWVIIRPKIMSLMKTDSPFDHHEC